MSGSWTNAPGVLQRTAELIPNQLRFSATYYATPDLTAPSSPSLTLAHGNRIHKLHVPPGVLRVSFAATIVGRPAPAPAIEYDMSMYVRPLTGRIARYG